MRSSIFFSCLLFLCPFTFAQEVEFIIPEQIDIIQGRLSVVFNDDIQEAEALKIIEQYQYEVLDVKFTPIVVSGSVEEPVDNGIIQTLNNEERVLTAEQFTTPTPIFNTRDESVRNNSNYKISVTFEIGTTQNQARKLLNKHLQLTSINLHSLPNEVIISVGNDDEKAFELLQDHEHIRGVSYLGKSEDS